MAGFSYKNEEEIRMFLIPAAVTAALTILPLTLAFLVFLGGPGPLDMILLYLLPASFGLSMGVGFLGLLAASAYFSYQTIINRSDYARTGTLMLILATLAIGGGLVAGIFITLATNTMGATAFLMTYGYSQATAQIFTGMLLWGGIPAAMMLASGLLIVLFYYVVQWMYPLQFSNPVENNNPSISQGSEEAAVPRKKEEMSMREYFRRQASDSENYMLSGSSSSSSNSLEEREAKTPALVTSDVEKDLIELACEITRRIIRTDLKELGKRSVAQLLSKIQLTLLGVEHSDDKSPSVMITFEQYQNLDDGRKAELLKAVYNIFTEICQKEKVIPFEDFQSGLLTRPPTTPAP